MARIFRYPGTIMVILIINMAIRMDSSALYRLMAWLSPSYPVGAFSYSHGLEWLVEDGSIESCDSMVMWIEDILLRGSGRNDAILFACAWRAATQQDMERLRDVRDHGTAFAGSAERHLEAHAQGRAFCDITRRTWTSSTLDRLLAEERRPVPYPVAVAAAAFDHGIALEPALGAYLHAFMANLVSAGLRLVPLGQTDGQRAMIALEPVIDALTQEAQGLDLSHLGSSALMADMAAMKHETQYTRLFRT